MRTIFLFLGVLGSACMAMAQNVPDCAQSRESLQSKKGALTVLSSLLNERKREADFLAAVSEKIKGQKKTNEILAEEDAKLNTVLNIRSGEIMGIGKHLSEVVKCVAGDTYRPVLSSLPISQFPNCGHSILWEPARTRALSEVTFQQMRYEIEESIIEKFADEITNPEQANTLAGRLKEIKHTQNLLAQLEACLQGGRK